MEEIYAILDYITENKIAETIPLDLPAHFLVGMALTIILLKCRLPFVITFLTIVLFALLKEVLDYQRMVEFDYLESLKDIAVTLLYPLILTLVRRKKNSASKVKTQEYSPKF